MSAEDNVELVERFHDIMEAADRKTLASLVREITHPEAQWSPLVTAVEGQTYRGKDGVLKFFEDFLESFEVRYDDREVRAVDERSVVMLCQMVLRGRGSGVNVVQELGVLYEFDDGLFRRGRAYPSHAAAIAAAEEVHA